jgi:hypothetical protein
VFLFLQCTFSCTDSTFCVLLNLDYSAFRVSVPTVTTVIFRKVSYVIITSKSLILVAGGCMPHESVSADTPALINSGIGISC